MRRGTARPCARSGPPATPEMPVRAAPAKALRQADAFISGGTARIVFPGLPPGGYAVAAYHDENGNGKLDTGFLGIPTEGLGASNDAKGFMGPPDFDHARLEIRAGENRIVVHVVY